MVNLKNYSMYALVITTLFLAGCGYSIKYNLNQKDIFVSNSVKPLKVQIARFADNRDLTEKEISARKTTGGTDFGDYTYDMQFQGDVAEGITNMLIKHLNYSKIFTTKSTLAHFGSEQLSIDKQLSILILDSLANTGVDAVLTGEINHFYGYYDRNIGREFLYEIPLAILSGGIFTWKETTSSLIMTTETTYYWYGPGLVLGGFLESLHKRSIKQHVQIKAKLISTSTYKPIWEDDFEIFSNEQKSMPGLSTVKRKFQITVWALRDAVNQMGKSLENAPF